MSRDRTYASFAYAQSRSGKTSYHTVVVLREDVLAPGPDLVMAQGFLFAPSAEDPRGTLNDPTPHHRARVGDVELALADWRRVDPEVAEAFRRLIYE